MVHKKPVILVTGASGQLGQELGKFASGFPEFEFVFATRNNLRIEDIIAVEAFFATHKPSYCINCAAYTAVDKAESEPEIAIPVNGFAPGILAEVSKDYDTRLIHISTDYVFDGSTDVPYREEDETSPIGIYGHSKLLGEKLARKNDPDSIIIRTSWLYSSTGKNFVKTMLRLMSEKEEIGVVNDQYGSPTYASDLAQAIMTIISGGKWVPGVFHYSNDGVISWFEFASEIKKLSGSKCVVNPITTEQYPTTAKRPAYSALNNSRIVDTYPIKLRNWKEGLADCLRAIGTIS